MGAKKAVKVFVGIWGKKSPSVNWKKVLKEKLTGCTRRRVQVAAVTDHSVNIQTAP